MTFFEDLFLLMKNPPSLRVWERFISKVDLPQKITDCWIWKAGKFPQGYGAFTIKSKTRKPHRVLWEWLCGELKRESIIDHVWCNTPDCVSPLHCAPSSYLQNMIRPGSGAYARKLKLQTHCKNGHLLKGDNLESYELRTKGIRACRTCKILAKRNRRRRRGSKFTYERPLPTGV